MAASPRTTQQQQQQRDSDGALLPLPANHSHPLATRHYSRVGEGLTAVPADLLHLSSLRSLCLHGNSISSLEGAGLSRLTRLTDLNLSSNALTSPLGLAGCTALRRLDLSSNRLPGVGGLGGLVRLERLLLAHNFISDLGGLRDLSGGALQVLDLRDNCIASLQQLSALAGCVGLRTLLLAGGCPGNPVCATPTYRCEPRDSMGVLEGAARPCTCMLPGETVRYPAQCVGLCTFAAGGRIPPRGTWGNPGVCTAHLLV